MKALSVRQPWASLIASGAKTIELRSWRTHHRGPLVIVAGRAADDAELARFGLAGAPRGVAVAVVDVVGVRPASVDDAGAACADVPAGAFAWCLANATALGHVAVKGRLCLFDIDDALVRYPEVRR